MYGQAAGEERLLRGYTGRLFLLVTFAFLALKIGSRLLPPLLPAIIDDLAISPLAAGAALSLLSVMRATLQYPSGRFSDGLSRKTVLLGGVVCGLVGFAFVATTPAYAVFLLGVTMLGIAEGLFSPAARALLSDLFVEKRGRAFGLHFVASDLAGVGAAGMAIVVGALLWRVAFLPSIVLLIPVPFLLYWWSRESITIQRVAFDLQETIHRLLGIPDLRVALLAYVCIVFASQGTRGFLAAFLVAVHGFSLEFAGAMFVVLYGTGAVVKPFAGWLSDRVSRLAVVSGGMFLASACLGVLLVAPSRAVVIGAIFGYAVGQRSFAPAFQAYLMDRFPDDSMGGDLGATRTVYMGIGSLGPVYMGYVIEQINYTTAYATLILCFLGGAAITFRLVS